jgi:hypothetical protein
MEPPAGRPTRLVADPRVIGGSAVLTLLFILFFDVSARAAVGSGSASFIELQMAFTTGRFADVLVQWDHGIDAMKNTVITLDYLFPIVYAILLSGLVARSRAATGAHSTAFLVPWVAAACDWIENSIHLWLLRDVHSAAGASGFAAPLVTGASAIAAAKYLLIALSLALILDGAARGWRRNRSRGRSGR